VYCDRHLGFQTKKEEADMRLRAFPKAAPLFRALPSYRIDGQFTRSRAGRRRSLRRAVDRSMKHRTLSLQVTPVSGG